MHPSFDTLFATIILFIVAVLFLIVLYFLFIYSYWWRKNIFYLKPIIPFGNFGNFFMGKAHTAEVTKRLHEELKAKGHKYGGIYFMNTPVFMPVDPQLIKKILTVDFEHFSDRGIYFNPEKDPIASHLFSLPSGPWRILRTKIAPTFTSGKIKNMFEIIRLCADGLIDATGEIIDGNKPVEINELTVRYTVDTIGRCAFGVECNCLKNPDEKFRRIADRLMNPPLLIGLKLFMAIIGPTLLKLGNLRVMEPQVINFFLDVVQQNIDYRESNKIYRNDFFQLLLDMKKQDEESDSKSEMKMTPKLMAAQAFVFFAAGFETSAMTINMCLFELSRHPDIQDRVRREILKVMQEHEGKVTYEGIKEMTYLEQVVQETLRKYPPLGFLNRVCTKDYKIPDSNVTLVKGTKVMVSIEGLQHDPEYFPDPEKFDPERFNDKNREKNGQFTYMPFGEGHRMCIGLRFGMVQTKVGLASMLANYEFSLNPMTKLPIEFSLQSFVINLKNGIYLNAKKINV